MHSLNNEEEKRKTETQRKKERKIK